MNKKIVFIALLLSACFPTYSQTVETVVNGLIPQVKGLETLIGAICYVSGIALGIKAILKFKEHNESKGQVKLSVPIIFFIASAMLLALPTFVSVGVEAFGFDTAGQFKY